MATNPPKTTNTRTFTLNVHQSLLTALATMSIDPSNRNLKSNITAQIEQLIKRYANDCIMHWKMIIPLYFNRRAMGMHKSKQGLYFNQLAFETAVTWHLEKEAGFQPSSHDRSNTGQLENALRISKLDETGATMYVFPCSPKSGSGGDYVNYLVHGAQPGGAPYSPKYDARHIAFKRSDDHEWGGISDKYWGTMQYHFISYLEDIEFKLNRDIENLLVKNNLLDNRNVSKEKKQPLGAEKKAVLINEDIIPGSPLNPKTTSSKPNKSSRKR